MKATPYTMFALVDKLQFTLRDEASGCRFR